MTDSEFLQTKYSRIFVAHPRVNLEPIYEVDSYIASEKKSGKKKLTAREISLGTGLIKNAVNRCLKRLVNFGYRDIAKGGRSMFFVSEESKDGTLGASFFGRENIGLAVEKHFGEVIELCESNSHLLDKDLEKQLKKIKTSMKSEKPNYKAYEKLVDKLWQEDFDKLKKILPRTTANRYS